MLYLTFSIPYTTLAKYIINSLSVARRKESTRCHGLRTVPYGPFEPNWCHEPEVQRFTSGMSFSESSCSLFNMPSHQRLVLPNAQRMGGGNRTVLDNASLLTFPCNNLTTQFVVSIVQHYVGDELEGTILRFPIIRDYSRTYNVLFSHPTLCCTLNRTKVVLLPAAKQKPE